MFEQAGSVDLVDFVFKSLSNRRNIRFEDRSNYIYAGDPEFQIGMADNPTLVIGDSVSAFRNGNVGIGTTSPTNILSLGGLANRIIWTERGTVADTAGYNLTVRVGGATVGATNKNGGQLILTGGISTGTGTSSVLLQTCPAGSTGSSDNTLATMLEITGNALSFFGVTAVTRQTELTDELTTITHTAPGTPDYALQDLTDTGGFGFTTKDEGNTLLSVVANLQTRVNELETKLTSYGLLIDVD